MHSGTRILFFLLMAVVITVAWSSFNHSVAHAQGGAAADGTEELDPDDTADDSASTKKSKPKKTLLGAVMAGGVGWVLIFLLLSLVAVGFIIEHFLTIRKSALMPEDVLGELEGMIQQGQVDQALEVCHNPDNESLVSMVIASGLERYKASEFGFAEYKAAVEEAGEDQDQQGGRAGRENGVRPPIWEDCLKPRMTTAQLLAGLGHRSKNLRVRPHQDWRIQRGQIPAAEQA